MNDLTTIGHYGHNRILALIIAVVDAFVDYAARFRFNSNGIGRCIVVLAVERDIQLNQHAIVVIQTGCRKVLCG